jgi:hypothetical protein
VDKFTGLTSSKAKGWSLGTGGGPTENLLPVHEGAAILGQPPLAPVVDTHILPARLS